MNIEESIRSLMRYSAYGANAVKDAGNDVKDTAAAAAAAATADATATADMNGVDGVKAAAEMSGESTSEAIETRIVILIALSVQGSSLPLTLLVPAVQGNIKSAIERLTVRNTHSTHPPSEPVVMEESFPVSDDSTSPSSPTATTTAATTASVNADSMETDTPTTPTPTTDNLESPSTIHDLEFRASALLFLTTLLDPVLLGEKIKSLALREPYGPRGKTALLFEDSDPSSVWRWEILR